MRSLREPVSLPTSLPLWPLRNSVLFPGAIIPIATKRLTLPGRMLHTITQRNQLVVVAARRDPAASSSDAAEVFAIGCVAGILDSRAQGRGVREVIVQGVCRARILGPGPKHTRFARERSCIVKIEPLVDPEAGHDTPTFDRLKRIGTPFLPAAAHRYLDVVHGAGQLADLIASHAALDLPQRQAILETLDVHARMDRLLEILASKSEVISR